MATEQFTATIKTRTTPKMKRAINKLAHRLHRKPASCQREAFAEYIEKHNPKPANAAPATQA